MTGSMIERVARELRERGKSNGSIIFGDDETGWRAYAGDARKLLAAMREPTPEIIRRGEAEYDKIFPQDAALADVMWPAMIDAALAEGE